MRHNQIQGWSYDMTEIFESGWRIARMTDWNVVKAQIGYEHHKALVVVPETLRRLKHLQRSLKNVDVFYYRKFSEVHLRKNELFRDELGHVVFVTPSLEPKQTECWLPFVAHGHVARNRLSPVFGRRTYWKRTIVMVQSGRTCSIARERLLGISARTCAASRG